MQQQVVDFDIDKKNLLRDVISKQTGSLNKAIKELFQNSFDAGATEIKVILKAKSLRFIDNGRGMTREEIKKYFRVFGATLKRGDSKKTGAFGMGRGQVFDKGYVLWRTQNYAMIVDIRKNLDYTFMETNKFIEGTDIIISLYKPLYSWNISSKIYQIKSDVVPPPKTAIWLNGEIYNPLITDFKNFSNDKYLVFESRNHTSKIYDGGLAVLHIEHSNYHYSINSYGKLDLNFARNELIQDKQSTKDLMYFINDIEELMASEQYHFDKDEAKNILRLLSAKRIKLSAVYDKRIIPLSNDKLVSFKDIIEKPNMGVLFGEKTVWSDDCIRQDYRVICESVRGMIIRIKTNFNLEKLDFLDKNPRELSKRGFHREIDSSKLKKNAQYFYTALEINEYIFKRIFRHSDEREKREIYLGMSDLSAAWTDKSPLNRQKWAIWINKSTIEKFQNKEEAIVKLWRILCHEYAHTEKNTKRDHHNREFYEDFEMIITKSIPYLSHCLRYIKRNFLKDKYQF